MADINAQLKKAMDGPAPQHKVAGQEALEITEGSGGNLHVKDNLVFQKVEELRALIEAQESKVQTVKDTDVLNKLGALESEIQATNDRLNQTLDTQLTGSIVNNEDLSSAIGTVTAGQEKYIALDPEKVKNANSISFSARRSSGEVASVHIDHRPTGGWVNGFNKEELQPIGSWGSLGSSHRVNLKTTRPQLIIKAKDSADLVLMSAEVVYWRDTVSETSSSGNSPIVSDALITDVIQTFDVEYSDLSAGLSNNRQYTHFGEDITAYGSQVDYLDARSRPHVDILVSNDTDTNLEVGVRIQPTPGAETSLRTEIIVARPVSAGSSLFIRSIEEPVLNRISAIAVNTSYDSSLPKPTGNLQLYIIGSRN